MGRYAKAIVALIAAPVTTFLGNIQHMIVSGGTINWELQLLGLGIGIWTAIVVWAVPNTGTSSS